MPVRTPRAGTEYGLQTAPVPDLRDLHQIVLPTPWEVGPVQIYAVDADPFTLIDTGVRTVESRNALDAALESIGRSVEDVERVVLTHYHGDHLGQVQSIRDIAGDVEVCAHADEVSMIEGFTQEKNERIWENEELFREYGVDEATLGNQRGWLLDRVADSPMLCEATSVERLLHDGQSIAFKSFEMKVHHVPGHTSGHIVLEEPATGTLITGDHVMGSSVPSTATYFTDELPEPGDPLHRRPRFKGLSAYLHSLRRLKGLGARTLLPAHGGVLRKANRAIDDALLFYDVRVQQIERGLRTLDAMGQDVTAWEIWKALFPKADPVRQMRNRMLMVIGALDVLEEQGLCVTMRRDDGVLLHRHTHS